MWELLMLLQSPILQGLGLALTGIALGILVYRMFREPSSRVSAALLLVALLGGAVFFFASQRAAEMARYPVGFQTYGPSPEGPWLPLKNVLTFFRKLPQFERVADIARDPNDVTSDGLIQREGEEVNIHLTTKEVIAEMAPGVTMNYWTFNGTVPGPMIRVKEGDMVHLTLTNDPTSLHHHNIDLHAVTGPGGGAVATNVAPGETKDFRFRAINPGLYVYHCAHPNVANHMAHGMYGMILVEPKEALAPVDREFYVMQGEVYTAGKPGTRGLQVIDGGKMLAADPAYIPFNGRMGGVNQKMKAKVGEKIRIYFGNGGVNEVSSFHVIGEIFDTVYPEASVGGALLKNVQTTLVPAGGATMVEFTVEVPGRYILVDHALARLDRGAWGVLEVTGEENHDIFEGKADVAEADGH